MDSSILENKKKRLVVIVACHNRVNNTRIWLEGLDRECPNNWEIKVIAVDDGSSDGTYEMLSASHLVSNVIHGEGSWFWAKSMSIGLDFAVRNYKFDYVIWANDDTSYYPGSLAYVRDNVLLHPNQVFVGQFVDPTTKQLTYGGQNKKGRHPFKYELVQTKDEGESCDVFNGNFVLFPASTIHNTGPIESRYEHAYADFDYSIRLTKAGYEIQILHKPLGECQGHPDYISRSFSFFERVSFAFGRKGFPYRSQILFLKKFGGTFWIAYFLQPYIRALFGITARK